LLARPGARGVVNFSNDGAFYYDPCDLRKLSARSSIEWIAIMDSSFVNHRVRLAAAAARKPTTHAVLTLPVLEALLGLKAGGALLDLLAAREGIAP